LNDKTSPATPEPKKISHFIVQPSTFSKLVLYMQTQPYKDVSGLMAELKTDVKTVFHEPIEPAIED